MPRRSTKPPAYRLHKGSGQARVILAGEHHYLGKFGTPESKEAYARLIAEHFCRPAAGVAAGNPAVAPDTTDGGTAAGGVSGVSGAMHHPPVPRRPSVNELLVAYLDFAATYYSDEHGTTQEYRDVAASLKPLRLLYGRTPAAEFGPKRLKAVREHVIGAQDLCRNVTKITGRTASAGSSSGPPARSWSRPGSTTGCCRSTA